MNLIIIIGCIWGISALISHARQARLAKEQMRQREAQARLLREQRAQAQRQREMEKEQKQLALQARQERVARERMEREQARQAEQLAKHEKRIADLEFKAAQASADIEHLRVVLDDLNESFELACQMADKAHAAGDDRREEQEKNKILTLRNKIHSAESKLAKAQHTREMAQRELAA